MKAIVLILVLAAAAAAQDADLERAIELYRNGNNASSLVILERLSKGEGARNARVWNYLGLAYIKIEDYALAESNLEKATKLAPDNSTFLANYGFALLLSRKDGKARKILTKAIEADPKNAPAYFLRATARSWDDSPEEALSDVETALGLQPDFAVARSLHANILVSIFAKRASTNKPSDADVALLRRAVETLETCIATCTNPGEVSTQKARIGGFRSFANYFSQGRKIESDKSAGPPESDSTPLKITFRPRPAYTDAARFGNVNGIVRVLALFDTNGAVTQAFVIKSLGSGLDESALRAARMIKFVPATKGGKPVAVVRMIEYSFEIR